MKKLTIAFVTALTILVSCKKESNNKPVNSSRTIRYEVTGNFSGNLIAVYTTQSGGTVSDEITTLPWNKEIKYDNNVTTAGLVISGSGGVAGQKITVTIKRGGIVLGTPIEATRNSSGVLTYSSPPVTF